MRTRTSLVLAAVLSLLVGTLPTVALAADVATSITITSIDSPVYRAGTYYGITAQFTPTGAQGSFTFEWSTDGAAWTSLGPAANVDAPTSTAYGWYGAPVDAPLGIRSVRARFTGDAGYESSVSEPVPQDVRKQPTSVDAFTVTNQSSGPIAPGSALTLHATGNAVPSLEFQRETESGWETISTVATHSSGAYLQRGADLDIEPLGQGTHRLRARYPGTETFAESSKDLTLTIDRLPTNTLFSVPTEVESGVQFELSGSVGAWDRPFPITGTLTLSSVGSGATLFDWDATESAHAWTSLSALGSHTLRLDYSGDSNYSPSSREATVQVVPDSVHATDVTVNYSTFYPAKDGYRDTLKVSGDRQESASVTIKIYSPGGAKVKQATIGSGTGSYAYAWTGRSASGAILAVGKYRITQAITDAKGYSKTWTSYSTLSKKKLVSKAAYITKKGSSYAAKGDPGKGSVTTSGSTVRLKGRYPGGWVGVGYSFKLPSATIYKSISFQAYNNGTFTAPSNELAVQNFQACPYAPNVNWNVSCFDHFKGLGSGSGSKHWDKTRASVTKNRAGAKVRGVVLVYFGTIDVFSVRVKVVYQILA